LTIYILFEPISVNWGHEAGLAGADGNIVFQKMFLSPDPPFLNTFTLTGSQTNIDLFAIFDIH
jgi:hypothetical protein